MPNTTYVLMGAVRSHRITRPEVVTGVRGARPNACNLCHLDETLDWTNQYLAEWHGIEPVEVSEEEREIAASLLWLLKGDATQRLMVAWSMGWESAQEASEVDWMPPFLAVLLNDPYSAIRDIAHRSLTTMPGYEDVEFDFLKQEAHFDSVADSVRSRWRSKSAELSDESLLLTPSGDLKTELIESLLTNRDNRPIKISE